MAVFALSANSVTAVQASPIGDCAEAEKQRRQAFMISAFRNFILQFSQDLVHNPINRCGTHTVASTDGLLLQMFDDVVNQRELHVVGIRNDEFFATAFRMQGNGVVGEYREANLSFVADDFNTVGLCRFMGDETPRTGTRRTVRELETGTDVIFRGI